MAAHSSLPAWGIREQSSLAGDSPRGHRHLLGRKKIAFLVDFKHI